MADSFESDSAQLVRRNRLWLATGAIPLMLALGFVLAGIVTSTAALAIPAFPMMLFGVLGTTYAYKNNKDPVVVPGKLAADARGITRAGELVVARQRLEQGLLARADGHFFVRFSQKGPRPQLLVRVKDAAEGRSLLRSLGFDATQSVAHIKAATQFFTWSLSAQLVSVLLPILLLFVPGMLVSSSLFARAGGAVVLPILIPFLLYIATLLLAPTHVRVGADGIATRWLGRARFYRFSEIEDVRPYRLESGGKVYLGVELVLARGVERICTGQEGWLSVDVEELIERIREARALHAEEGSEVDQALLARNGRELGDWLTALRAIGAGANAGMREPPVPADRLLRLIEDPRAPPLARVSAAVAALPSMDEQARVRVRAAAETTASTPLRDALERVLDGGDDSAAMTEALAELEALEAERERSSKERA